MLNTSWRSSLAQTTGSAGYVAREVACGVRSAMLVYITSVTASWSTSLAASREEASEERPTVQQSQPKLKFILSKLSVTGCVLVESKKIYFKIHSCVLLSETSALENTVAFLLWGNPNCSHLTLGVHRISDCGFYPLK